MDPWPTFFFLSLSRPSADWRELLIRRWNESTKHPFFFLKIAGRDHLARRGCTTPHRRAIKIGKTRVCFVLPLSIARPKTRQDRLQKGQLFFLFWYAKILTKTNQLVKI